jgi:predicted AAA+ superfamily ATPase
MDKLMNFIPRTLGEKFVYSHVDKTESIHAVQRAIEALEKARVCHIVHSTAANGIPLSAEINEKFSKFIFVDVGLCSASLELSLTYIGSVDDLTLINKGAIAEQVTGQLLRTVFPCTQSPQLYYWVRLHKEKGASAEVDYVIAHGALSVPIEVKAGATGSLKSLHVFMELKGLSKAMRVCSGIPNISPIALKTTSGATVSYELRSIPFYLLSEVHRLLK